MASIKNTPRARGRGHLLGLAGVDRERLFAQHGLAGLDAQQAMLFVKRVRRGHIDRIHAGIVRQRGVARVRPRGAKAPGKLLGRGGGARADRHKLGALGRAQALGKYASDPPGA
jgi:hypothetical protein